MSIPSFPRAPVRAPGITIDSDMSEGTAPGIVKPQAPAQPMDVAAVGPILRFDIGAAGDRVAMRLQLPRQHPQILAQHAPVVTELVQQLTVSMPVPIALRFLEEVRSNIDKFFEFAKEHGVIP